MQSIQNVLREIHQLDEQTQQHTALSGIHPGMKVLVTVFFLVLTTSFDKYNLTGLLGMCIYLIVVYQLGEISLGGMLLRLKELFLLLFLLGAANLFFDRTVISHWGQIPITGGMFSFLTLYGKGVFAVLAGYALVSTTGMENVCYALQVFHLPRILITTILLTYRYLILFVKEVDRVSLAYAMRAPGQRGIHCKAWGSLVGSMLLRSMDRSETVYQSMQLRGFQGQLRLQMREPISIGATFAYGIVMTGMLVLLRFIPVFELLGSVISR
ncbi:MAG: cobalt ECF transporter T component CbiQ [Lachnospiraceae bacterium]|nr:cobalt ECF transporter T component CbiQ [Lachnospiraceae bacterium]